jgi:hypothetical protein
MQDEMQDQMPEEGQPGYAEEYGEEEELNEDEMIDVAERIFLLMA